MATKLSRKEIPSGFAPSDFKYMGRPAADQGDFSFDVGIADMACVNQFGENNSKYYHAGVVSARGQWFVYLEWGRIKGGHSWNGSFSGQDFQFVQCGGESDARSFFRSQCEDKNVKRLQETAIAGRRIWAARAGKDGYLVQRLATRERGLPDAYTIKDGAGVKAPAPTAPAPTAAAKAPTAPSKTFEPQVISLARALVGGIKTYARAAAAATGIVPTQAAIDEVRNDCIPAALTLLAKVGHETRRQLADTDLQNLSKYVATIVPRPIPHNGDAMAILLTSDNILAVQQDLDTFEAALRNEDFSVDVTPTTPQESPDTLLNASLRWIDPNGAEGRALKAAFLGMSNRRHSYLSRDPNILNMFAVSRPDRDAQFMASVRRVGGVRQGRFALRANLQPTRTDLTADEKALYGQANVIFTLHGTRTVNIAPILQTHFRLPRQLAGVPICGANFGHGNYQATDFRKAAGYTSTSSAAWSSGGGAVSGRGAMMFFCDMLMGDAYRAPSTGSWVTPPNGKDSVFGVGGDRGHSLQNDEHVIFDPSYARIRYVMELNF